MTVNTINYRPTLGSDTTRDFSQAIWGDCPLASIREGSIPASMIEDDFLNFAQHTSDQSVQKYDSFVVNNAQFVALGGVEYGVAELNTNSTDNDAAVLSGYNPNFNIQDAKASKKLWFEARVKKASVADNALAMFLGLAFDFGSSVTVAKAACLTDNDGALGAFSYLGFHVDQADGDALDFVYKAEGGADTVVIAGVQTLVADTYYKLGFVYDPTANADKRIKVFIDGVEQTTYVTEANIAAAAFPDNEGLAPVWCGIVGAGAESKAQMDWWRCVQLT